MQCSILKPSYEFHFEGLSNFNAAVEGLVQIQYVDPRIHIWITNLVLNLCMKYMVHVSTTMWITKNQPSNSTSCSDNAIRLLILVARIWYWGLQVTSSFLVWGCVLKGCSERGIFWRAKLHLKGIEDFNLQHCSNDTLGNLPSFFSFKPNGNIIWDKDKAYSIFHHSTKCWRLILNQLNGIESWW